MALVPVKARRNSVALLHLIAWPCIRIREERGYDTGTLEAERLRYFAALFRSLSCRWTVVVLG